MTKLLGMRVWSGIAVAALGAILISFGAGCIYSIILIYPEMPMNGVMEAFIFVGGAAAIVASVVTIPGLLLIGLPLYVTSVKKRKVSCRIYAIGGFLISLFFGSILTVMHVFDEFLMAKDFYFAISSTLIAGPVATSVFWVVVRPDHLVACNMANSK